MGIKAAGPPPSPSHPAGERPHLLVYEAAEAEKADPGELGMLSQMLVSGLLGGSSR